MSTRLSYALSCDRLRQLGLLTADDPAPMPSRMPRYDDEAPLGVNFFRWGIETQDLSNLTLPRTYFGRSDFARVSFANSDLHESSLCWNDFIEVNFDGADLSRSDMRASWFKGVRFANAVLENVDLRRSTFENCDFAAAIMKGAVLTHDQGAIIPLSEAQRSEIDWRDDDGEEPDGG